MIVYNLEWLHEKIDHGVDKSGLYVKSKKCLSFKFSLKIDVILDRESSKKGFYKSVLIPNS